MTAHGWFADLDTDTAPTDDCRWQPVLQVTALCLPFPVWFPSEAACVEFIEKDILGLGLLTDQPSPLRSSLADRLTPQQYDELVAEWTAKFAGVPNRAHRVVVLEQSAPTSHLVPGQGRGLTHDGLIADCPSRPCQQVAAVEAAYQASQSTVDQTLTTDNATLPVVRP